MPATLPTKAHDPKATAPRPKTERDFGVKLLEAIEKSPMLADAKAIMTAVSELLELTEAFEREYDNRSLARDIERAGLGRANDHALWLCATILKDVRGLCYALETAETFMSSVIADHSTADHETPAAK